MTHPTEMLSALLDGELGDADRARVEAHVAGCAECADALRELRSLDAFARGVGPAAAPAGYHEGLAARLRPRLRGERTRARPVQPWVWALAAGLAIAVIAPIVLRQQTPLAPVPPPVATGKENAAPAPVATPPAAEMATSKVKADSDGRLQERARDTPAMPARQAAAPAKTVDAFAAPPPAVAPAAPPAAAAETREADRAAGEEGFAGGLVGGVAGAAPAASAPVDQAAAEPKAQARNEGKDERVRSVGTLAGRADAPSSLKKARAGPEDARATREAWRRIVDADPDGKGADAARVRVIEAGVEAYRLGGDEADRLQALHDADAYLARADAAQADHVRASVLRLREGRRR